MADETVTVDPPLDAAYSTALCWESCSPELYHAISEEFHPALERFARIVAYKVAKNLENGLLMDELCDPLTHVDCKDYPPLILGDSEDENDAQR